MNNKDKTICYFGFYNPDYSRNSVLINGLKAHGFEVLECQSSLTGFAKYGELIKKHKAIKNDYDIMIVAFPGQLAMTLARFLTRKKIIFDAFTSLYDSNVFDRKVVSQNSLMARFYWFIDWLPCRLADMCLTDTQENIKYFTKTFRLNEKKFIRVFVGTDIERFSKIEPIKRENKIKNKFIVHFHGTYVPLQGVEIVLEAAKILKNESNILFQIIGSKIKDRHGHEVYKNIKFLPNVNYKDLYRYIARADICLGIFGGTSKAKQVIPNKVFEGIIMHKPIITADTKAIKELFIDNDSVLLCKINDPNDLADKIKELFINNVLYGKLEAGANLVSNNITPSAVVNPLIKKINNF